MYANVVWLSYKLARKGFLVATGGGPGAMEAGNLGAYLAQRFFSPLVHVKASNLINLTALKRR